MKKTLIYGSLLLLASLLPTGCDLEHSGNGRLDGMWHLERVDTLQTGGVLDLSQRHLYWSFQARLLQLDDKDWTLTRSLLRFEHSGSTLRLYEPYFYNREEGDEPMTSPEPLKPYGVNAIDETFSIEKLSGSKLILVSNMLKLSLRKM